MDLSLIDIPSPNLNKLTVKPIMTHMYHTDEWEGPCRFNVVPMEEEKQRAHKAFKEFRENIINNTPGIRRQADYGNHLSMVYGDYSARIKRLGRMMNIDVVVES